MASERSNTLNTPFSLLSFTKAEQPEYFQKALAVRIEVFVKEQHVPMEYEQDAIDDIAQHWLLLNQENNPIATGRAFPVEGNVLRIGRMAVLKDYRGYGCGKQILQAILNFAKNTGQYSEAILDAQTHALGFYQSLGFIAKGDEFLDENIPHYLMRISLINCLKSPTDGLAARNE